MTGGRSKPSNLSNAFEALLGAIFIDGGWDAAYEATIRLYGPRIERAVEDRLVYDAKSRLLQAAQSMVPQSEVTFRISREEGPVHERVFHAEALVDGVVQGVGAGATKKAAEQVAARAVLDRLGTP